MRINFLGDSITEGAAASSAEKKYVSLVGDILGCEVCNFGVGGTRIAKQKTPSECERYDEDFLTRAKKMGDADMVFIFGGTNDYGHGDAEMGNIDDNTSYTFRGALNNLIEYLTEKYGKEKLCFILPIPRYNQSSVYGEGRKTEALYPLSDYINAEREIFEAHGIKYLDMSGMFPEPKTNAPGELLADGLHPTDKGHRMIAEYLSEYIRSHKNSNV